MNNKRVTNLPNRDVPKKMDRRTSWGRWQPTNGEGKVKDSGHMENDEDIGSMMHENHLDYTST